MGYSLIQWYLICHLNAWKIYSQNSIIWCLYDNSSKDDRVWANTEAEQIKLWLAEPAAQRGAYLIPSCSTSNTVNIPANIPAKAKKGGPEGKKGRQRVTPSTCKTTWWKIIIIIIITTATTDMFETWGTSSEIQFSLLFTQQ